MEDWFGDYGKPKKLRSDGGPQFRSEFDAWCKTENIIHRLSSPYNHESNGHAEVGVREIKHLLEKTSRNWNKFRRALREYRNTPQFDGLSPAQWLFGHRQMPLQLQRLMAEFRMKGSNSTWTGRRRSMERSKSKLTDPDVLSHFNFILETRSGSKTTNPKGGLFKQRLSAQVARGHSSSMTERVISLGTNVS